MTLTFSANLANTYGYEYDHNNRLTLQKKFLSGHWSDQDRWMYDALGRRIEHYARRLATTTRYYYGSSPKSAPGFGHDSGGRGSPAQLW
ncbi:MAG: hypothetical protein GY778_00425 [bacterium]|nr:hypothetical protein [bacterium]